ncbi:MAG: NAD-dependent malic enzyme [Acidipropionibacterium jensenii]|uniref:NAD-dependent malic enzyme n=1 Tax=Acidipropionibacterium jensenii TaxID=1749 RepID=UPI0026490AF4|nr:NAD-dependent malic enzyme [Acidipropionibacterium jensenii]MDN6513581.1 NAD-dependent malic enzyme [Acidipropionibacterium jensenii]
MTSTQLHHDFEFGFDGHGEVLRIAARGSEVLANAVINRGTAFSAQERKALGLKGLLPSGVTTMEDQLKRVYVQYRAQRSPLDKYLFLNTLHDRNEVLYYRLLSEHIEEMLPIVYTPTIGQAIPEYSHWYHRPRGVYLSIDDPEGIEDALLSMGHGPDEVDLIVATDSEGILGIGDQGVGGVAITIGKLAVYTAAAGIHPHRVLPVVLDTGTDNLDLLNDEVYLGVRHARVRGERYDAFIDRYVTTAHRLFPHAMLHWEDFGASNATRILNKYRDDYCTFNDDIQGTAAVVAAAVMSAVQVSGTPLADQRIVIHGAGTAGIGIARLLVQMMCQDGVDPETARSRVWGLGSRGLLREGIAVRDFQQPFARSAAELAGWTLDLPGHYELADVVRNVHPTILIGCSAQPGAFTEQIVRDMAQSCQRPIIMPLSNPTDRAEASPADLISWTSGRALVATGSPFPPVQYNGVSYRIAQANNALVFPGIGLGVTAARATRISDSMITAAVRTVARSVDPRPAGASLLPEISGLLPLSAQVGLAVALAAQKEGLATAPLDNPVQAIYDAIWRPDYPRVKAI